jgi:PKD repeat protein
MKNNFIYFITALTLLFVMFTSCQKKPSASFTASAYDTKERVVINFANTSTDADSYLWDFGDSTVATADENPSHSYDTAGYYLVTMTAYSKNGNKEDVAYAYMTITTSEVTPVAGFSANPTTAAVGETIVFTDLSTNTPISWSWSFGDGKESTLQNPVHVYNIAGTYTVTLTVSNDAGSNTATKTNYITITN